MRLPRTISGMDFHNTSHSWLSAFAARLMQLRPSMSAEQAVRRAVASIHEAAGLDPWIAAEIFALARSTAPPSATPSKHHPDEPHAKRYRELFGPCSLVSVGSHRL